jgi:hypothetical protein
MPNPKPLPIYFSTNGNGHTFSLRERARERLKEGARYTPPLRVFVATEGRGAKVEDLPHEQVIALVELLTAHPWVGGLDREGVRFVESVSLRTVRELPPQGGPHA